MQLLPFVITVFLSSVWAIPHHYQTENCTIDHVIETSSGPVAGHAATYYPEVSEYLGIRFAQAPVGELRFAAPVKYSSSSFINASTFGSSCPGLPSKPGSVTPSELALSNITSVGLELLGFMSSPDISEDCLFVNVWSKPQVGERRKAVMVFIYGGGFDGGSSSMPVQNGAGLVDQGDVVVVSFNYRLSIFGFPGNPKSQSNVAFLDQRLAMEWVRENVANFGGDPSRITLFGQSAGAASSDYYAYAWKSDPIAAGIILESGTVFSFGLPYSESAAASTWYDVASSIGCGNASTDTTTLLACMRSVNVSTIQTSIPSTGIYALLSAFGPTVDESIVFSNYSERTPAQIPILVGSTDYEAGIFRTELALANTTFPDLVWDEYNLAGFTCPAGVRANASLKVHNPTWRYRYHGVFPNTDISSEGGAYHGAELPLVFGSTVLFAPNSTAEEISVQAYIQGAWSAFAKDPVNGLTTYDGGWPMYNPTEKSLVRLSYENRFGTNLALPMLYDVGCVNASLSALITSIFD